MFEFFAAADMSWLATAAIGVVIIGATWAAEHVAYKVIGRIGSDRGGPVAGSSIFANISRVVIWVFGVALMLRVCFNYDVTGFIAALGIGGIALSLGLQDTLSNLIGGLQVSLGKLVVPGQYIEVLGQSGRVTDISWRHTTIVDSSGCEHLIPNSLMNKNAITDIGQSNPARVTFVVAKNTDTEELARQIEECAKAEFDGKIGPLGVHVRYLGWTAMGLSAVASVDLKRKCYGPEEAIDHVTRLIEPIVAPYTVKVTSDTARMLE